MKEVITEVIFQEVKNPHINQFVTVSRVDISKDLRHAKVYLSMIATQAQKEQTVNILQSAAGFIGVRASKKVSLRFFPQLTFKIDDTVDKQSRIEDLLKEIHEEDEKRHKNH